MHAKWERIKYLPNLPLGKNGERVTGSAEHIELSRKTATEGMVLLKNELNVLPLEKGVKVALFGIGSADYVKGGGGSGDVYTAYTRNLCDGMEIKESEQKLSVYTPLNNFYRKEANRQYEEGVKIGKTMQI